MEKEKHLTVYIGCVDSRFSATINGFHRFQISNYRISDIFSDLPKAIEDHLLFCRVSKYNYPDILKEKYQIEYKYTIYAAFALIPDLFLLSRETKVPYKQLREYVTYTRRPSGLTFKKIFAGINRIGEKICALEEPDFTLCSNEELLSEYSGILLHDILLYKNGKVHPQTETTQKLLDAMHKIGKLYQNLTW